MFGKVDRIDPLRGGGIEIIDYKTGTNMFDERDLRGEPATWVYVAAAEAAYDEIVRRVRLIYLPAGVDVSWEPERDDVKELRKRLIRTVGEIEKETAFAATPGEHCRWCQFALRCEERTRVALEEFRSKGRRSTSASPVVPIEERPGETASSERSPDDIRGNR